MIQAQAIGDELVIPLSGSMVLVRSKTQPDSWHVVEGNRCNCAGYSYRGKCRHISVAAEASRVPCYWCSTNLAPIPVDPDARPTCSACRAEFAGLEAGR